MNSGRILGLIEFRILLKFSLATSQAPSWIPPLFLSPEVSCVLGLPEVPAQTPVAVSILSICWPLPASLLSSDQIAESSDSIEMSSGAPVRCLQNPPTPPPPLVWPSQCCCPRPAVTSYLPAGLRAPATSQTSLCLLIQLVVGFHNNQVLCEQVFFPCCYSSGPLASCV